MANLIYRVVSPCGLLGYGFPQASFATALERRVNAIVCNAGTIELGPYLLGAATSHFRTEEIRHDLQRVIAAAHRLGCPVIIGSAGLGGGDRNLADVVRMTKDIFARLRIERAHVATISSELVPELALAESRTGSLRSLGPGFALSEKSVNESTIVGQMGVHPIITALDSGAQYIIAGRACGASIFAADMIRRGIDPGLAYHVGQVLESGAAACEPASTSDSLIAEIYDDQSALFVAPNPERRCTVHSLAVHALYKECHPQVHFYPEGVLSTEQTEYHSRSSRMAGIKGSRLLRAQRNWNIKIEGAHRLGHRKVSLLYIDAAKADKVPAEFLVYGRDAVKLLPSRDESPEMGILIETRAATRHSAELLGEALRSRLNRFDYPGRKGAAGNLAFPLSPLGISFRREDGYFGHLIPAGIADPSFFASLHLTEAAAIENIQTESPDALAFASHSIQTIDADNPMVLVRTIDAEIHRLNERHRIDVARVASLAELKPGSRLNIDAPDAYAWSLFHILQNEQAILDEMFPISHFEANGGKWTQSSIQRPVYTHLAKTGSGGIDVRNLSVIDSVEPRGRLLGTQGLTDIASVVRTQNVGVNLLSIDLLFNSADSYESALLSNAFCRANLAKTLALPARRIVASYFADVCNAIKIVIDRPVVAGSSAERDLFGEQQQMVLRGMIIPMYSRALAVPSSF
jgi:hypothetical protein